MSSNRSKRSNAYAIAAAADLEGCSLAAGSFFVALLSAVISLHSMPISSVNLLVIISVIILGVYRAARA